MAKIAQGEDTDGRGDSAAAVEAERYDGTGWRDLEDPVEMTVRGNSLLRVGELDDEVDRKADRPC